MIKNFSHGTALITFDGRLKQIRLLKDGEIKFIELSNTENEILSYCNDGRFFKRLLRDILKENGFLCSLSLISEVTTE